MSKIYFIQAGNENLFKIGLTTGQIKSRIAQLQTGNPYKLNLYRYLDSSSTRYDEKVLHGFFSKYRLEGEWFGITKRQIDDYISKASQVEMDNAEWVEMVQKKRLYVYHIPTGKLYAALSNVRSMGLGDVVIGLLATSVAMVMDGEYFVPIDTMYNAFVSYAEKPVQARRDFDKHKAILLDRAQSFAGVA